MDQAPNRIREHRMAEGLSQQALADRIGTSKVTISDLETGKMQFTQDYMRRIAYALEILPADLLPLSDNPGGLTARERRLIEQLRAAAPDQRDQLHKVADVIAPFKGAEQPEDRLVPRKRVA
ncbi:helix-turn-helix domain-containing protein [Novosphingobium sp.]|uniref:helix-turn-helix transcriptional regulator n=1 Tax=Novosphingobium sp. TaxID=1874826 RepID=UPI00286E98DE|nr:helix-turn-helix domain-containing protein [Novosphingobium sp.]